MNIESQSQQPNDEELRSAMPKPTPSGARFNTKQIGVVVGVVVVLLALGWGVFALMRQAKNGPVVPQMVDSGGMFGKLPMSGEKTPTPTPEPRTTSGLSGNICERPDRRPIAVMLAGDPINRPMSGFSKADMVWELPVLASNVTRLMGVYQCGEPTDIGSVRSVRHDYLFLADGIDAIVAHWGGSFHALNRISAGEFQTLNALVNPDNAFFRKSNLPAPYNGFTTYARLWGALEKLGYRTTTTFKGYDFKDDASKDQRPAGGRLTVAWPGAFRVHYEYDPETNRYIRYWAGTKQVDAEDGKVVAPSSVVVLRATNGSATPPDGGYNDVGIEGKGQMTVYQDGKAIPGTWQKNELDKKDPMHFYNEQGQPIIFTRGQVWVMTPSDDISVTWEPK